MPRKFDIETAVDEGFDRLDELRGELADVSERFEKDAERASKAGYELWARELRRWAKTVNQLYDRADRHYEESSRTNYDVHVDD